MAIPLAGDSRARGFEVPHPLRAGAALACIGVLPVVLGATDAIRPLSGLIFAAIFAVTGLLRGALAYHELSGLRRSADRELRLDHQAHLYTPLVQWRTAELTSPHNRRVLARSLARIERDVSPTSLPGASPLNRPAVRPHLGLVRRLADRLDAIEQPVEARGVLLVEDFLTSSESPLYARERASSLRATLLRCLEAVEPRSDAAGDFGSFAHRIGALSDDAPAEPSDAQSMIGGRR